MEIVKSAEGFKKVNDVYKFSYLQLIVQKSGRLYRAKCPYDLELLQTEDRGPKVKPTWTVLDSPYDYYVKTPDLEQQILREVETCEILSPPEHCLLWRLPKRQRANPRYLSKSDFLSSGRLLVDDTTIACLDGILAGIHHLHSLGLVHNDITPSNIMFEGDGTPVLIDFDSCRKVGESLHGRMDGTTLTF
jgi:hypothetical protein